MKHLELIGEELKSDVLNDLFETYEVDVVYRYDRTNENMPDEYVAQLPELGLEFLFDSQQKLRVLFIENMHPSGFDPFEDDDESLPRFLSKGDAIAHGARHGVRLSEGRAEFLGTVRDWVRFERQHCSVHYEFVDSELRKITVQARDA